MVLVHSVECVLSEMFNLKLNLEYMHISKEKNVKNNIV